jgi:hypothetical protein
METLNHLRPPVHNVHDPDVTFVFPPGKVQVPIVHGKRIADISSSALELCDARDRAVAQGEFPEIVLLSWSCDDAVIN